MNERDFLSPEWYIQIKGLTKSFGNLYALKGIDLNVKKGDYLTVFGPNGAGKTTLIKLLSTLSKPTNGTVIINGTDLRRNPATIRSQVSVVGHHTFLYDNLNVYENLKFYGKMYNVSNLERRIQEVSIELEVESRLYDRVGTLSRGLQQRVSFARAVLHDPPVILLDEPDVGLDPRAVQKMKRVLEDLNSGDRTVVMTTHNLERGLELSNQVVILNKGEIVYHAARTEIDTSVFHETYDSYTGTGR